MAHIDLQGGKIVLSCSPRESDLARSIPGMAFDNRTSTWRAAPAWSVCKAARGVFGPGMTVGPELARWSNAKYEELQALLAAKAGEAMFPEPRLYPYQQAGAAWMALAGRGGVFNDMGTGKTPMSICAVESLGEGAFPALVICTKSMLYKWVEEWKVWGSEDRTFAVATGTAGERRKALESGADVVVIAWDNIRRHSRLAPFGSVTLSEDEKAEKELNAAGFRTVIADEAHKAADAKAKQTRAWWLLSHRARYSFALTGTPLVNNAVDTWTIMHGLWPNEYPAKTKFIDRFTVSAINMHGALEVFGLAPATTAELYSFLDPYFIRRTLAEVRPEIAQPIHDIRYVDMDPKQGKAYDQMAQHMLAELDGGIVVADNPLVQAGRLEMFAAAMGALDSEGKVILTAPSCKVDALLDILDEQPGAPVVVFTRHRLLIDLCEVALGKKGVSCMRITGNESAAERTANVAAFQAGDVQVALCTYDAGSESITLTRAARMVLLQRHRSNVKTMQAIGRIARIGQTADEVIVTDVRARGSIEDAVAAGVEVKAEYLQEILRDHLLSKVPVKKGRKWCRTSPKQAAAERRLSQPRLVS